MNECGYIEQVLRHYEDVLDAFCQTGYLPEPYGDDVLENYLFHVLTDSVIRHRLEDERLQVVLKRELLAFFRYVLERHLLLKDMKRQVQQFDLCLVDRLDEAARFLSAHLVSSSDFNEFLQLVSGIRWSETDYLLVRDLQYVRNSCPVLHEITVRMGRTVGKGEDTACVRLEEAGIYGECFRSDIVGVQEGNDILSVLPSELVYLSSPLLESVFYMKYADRRLQTFARRSCSPARPVGQSGEREAFRREGAMIVCVDTSGSMFGRKERVAKSMAWELVEMARKRRRSLYLITFAVRVRCVEVTSLSPDEWYRDFLKATFTGGTDCNAVLWKALKMLGHEGFAFADVLLVSDFEFGECTEAVQTGILEARQRGTRFYGLSLGKAPNKLCGLFDKIWQV